MTVCKFFQQGSCRYGQNCRFEHIYGSKYSYHSNTIQQQSVVPGGPNSVTDEQLVNQVHSDVQAALRGNQWLLSSYAPFKEKPAFPGITDLSPEEARLFIYEAKSNNNVDQAVAYMNNLFKEARSKHEQLLMKNVNITRIFRSLYKGEVVASPFQNNSQDSSVFSSNNALSIFRSAIQTSPFEQNNTPSLFNQNNQTPSIFAQNNVASAIFQTTANCDPAKSIFAQANQNTYNNQNTNMFGEHQSNNLNLQTNPFGVQADSSAKSIFAQATQNVFTAPNNTQTPTNLFANASQSLLGQTQQPTFGQNQANIFQKSESPSVFGLNQNVFQQTNTVDMSIYSKLEDLSAEDIEAFTSDDFKMGFVPELPPPHSLCM